MSRISVIKAKYESGYKLQILFSDNTLKTVDFEPFLNHKSHQLFEFYKKPNNFKKFKVEKGNVVWGKDWDLIFPVTQLYQGFVEFDGAALKN